MPKIDIKTITEFDPSLTEHIGQLLGQLSSRPIQFTDDDLRAIIDSSGSQLMVMYADSKPIGMITLGSYLAPTGRKVWIEDVVIDSSMRGKGMGRKLIDHAIEQTRLQAPAALMLTSRPSRIEANKLYHSAGFKQRETNVYKLEITQK